MADYKTKYAQEIYEGYDSSKIIKCNKCGELKPYIKDYFYPRYLKCKHCVRIQNREKRRIHYENNKEDLIEYSKKKVKELNKKRIIYGVYFIECSGYIKIGRAKNINRRISSLQIGNPFKLNLIYFHECDNYKEHEQFLTTKFDKYRYFRDNSNRGEWYYGVREIYDYIENLRHEKTYLNVI